MDTNELGHVVWCDLAVTQLKIHSRGPWDTKDGQQDPIPGSFKADRTHREKMVSRGS